MTPKPAPLTTPRRTSRRTFVKATSEAVFGTPSAPPSDPLHGPADVTSGISRRTLKRVAEQRLELLERKLTALQEGPAHNRGKAPRPQLEQLQRSLEDLERQLQRSSRRRDLLVVHQQLAGYLYRLRALTSAAPQSRHTAS